MFKEIDRLYVNFSTTFPCSPQRNGLALIPLVQDPLDFWDAPWMPCVVPRRHQTPARGQARRRLQAPAQRRVRRGRSRSQMTTSTCSLTRPQ